MVQTIDLNFNLSETLYTDVLKFMEYVEEAETAEPKTPLEETIRQSYKKKALQCILHDDDPILNIPFSHNDNTFERIYNLAVGVVFDQIEKYEPKFNAEEYSINVNGNDYNLSVDKALVTLGITSFNFDTCIEAMYIDNMLSQVQPKGIEKKYRLRLQKIVTIYAVLVRKENELLPDSPEELKAFINKRCNMFTRVLKWSDVKDVYAFFLAIWKRHGSEKNINTSLKVFLKYTQENLKGKHLNIITA